jgi:metal-sulfur cluster biosynthetic enzyme
MATPEQVYQALAQVLDPELALPITDLGLVYDVQVEGARAEIKVTLTSPGCALGPTILDYTRNAALTVDGIADAVIELVWDPPWSIDMMSDEARMKLGML